MRTRDNATRNIFSSSTQREREATDCERVRAQQQQLERERHEKSVNQLSKQLAELPSALAALGKTTLIFE